MTTTPRSNDRTCAAADELANATAHLELQLRGRLHDASISVHRGGVVISGRAGSYYVKQLAQHAVMNCVSLPIAANEIEVLRA